ncbi:MAG: DUF6034 family protein [Clostridiales bacterium]|nr:DUF6034 family protein [Clostridiales bacterium]
MKRTIALLIAVLMLLPLFTACQPTPENDFVVNIGDDTLEDKLNATPAPETSPDPNATPAPYSAAGSGAQLFPEHWDAEEVMVKDKLYIGADAEIVTKSDGAYPVYRVRETPFTMETLIPLIEKISGKKPVLKTGTERTKDYYIKELELFLKQVEEQQAWVDAGRPPLPDHDETVFSDEEIDERTRDLMQKIANAPDEVSSEEVTDFSGLKMGMETEASNFLLEDGSCLFVAADKKGLFAYKGWSEPGERSPYVYTEHRHEDTRIKSERDNSDPTRRDPSYNLWKEPGFTLEEAEEMLKDELARLGLENYSPIDKCKGTMIVFSDSGKRYGIGGWYFQLADNPGNYPYSYDLKFSSELRYDKDDTSVANARVVPETMEMFFTKDGLLLFQWLYPKEIVGVVNTNVKLLSMDELWDRTVKTLTMCFPLFKYQKNAPGRVFRLSVWKMTLTWYLIRIKDSDEYYAIPCWNVIFDGHKLKAQWEDERMSYSAGFLINAVDGSVIRETSWVTKYYGDD